MTCSIRRAGKDRWFVWEDVNGTFIKWDSGPYQSPGQASYAITREALARGVIRYGWNVLDENGKPI